MTTIIQGITIRGFNVYDTSFNSAGALLYLDSGQNASYSGSGTTWTDLSGNSNNATLNGTPTYSTAWNGDFVFGGTSSQYALTNAAKYNVTYSGKTVFVVARLAAGFTGAYECLFGSFSGARNFNTYVYNNGTAYQLHFSAVTSNGVSTNIPLVVGQWFSAAITQDATGLISYYFNGQLVSTSSGTLDQWATNGGESVAHSDNYWNGDLPVVAVYGRALNSSEILQNHNSLAPRYGLGIVTSNLLANYDTAGYSSGSAVSDTSGNGRSLTLYNSPSATTVNRSPVLSYNGSTQYGFDTTGYGTLLNTGSGYTFDVWVNPSNVTNSTVLAEWQGNALPTGYNDSQMGFLNNIVAGYYNGSGSSPSVTYTPVSTSTWYNIVFTYNGTNQGTMYVNGTLIGVTPVSPKVNPTPGTFVTLARSDSAHLYLGGLANYFNGQIGPWKVYSSAMTATQVSQNFNALRGRYGV